MIALWNRSMSGLPLFAGEGAISTKAIPTEEFIAQIIEVHINWDELWEVWSDAWNEYFT